MWNNLACTSYDICSTRRITEAQRRHLQSLTSVRPTIDTRTPWQPSHSLSKWTNKYTNQRNQKIQHDNKVLLEKMMVIDKKSSNMNPKKLAQEIYPIKSMAEYQRRRNQENLKQENNKIIERIDNATQKSNYGKQMWMKESKKFEQYKSNILRSKSKKLNYLYIKQYKEQIIQSLLKLITLTSILWLEKQVLLTLITKPTIVTSLKLLVEGYKIIDKEMIQIFNFEINKYFNIEFFIKPTNQIYKFMQFNFVYILYKVKKYFNNAYYHSLPFSIYFFQICKVYFNQFLDKNYQINKQNYPFQFNEGRVCGVYRNYGYQQNHFYYQKIDRFILRKLIYPSFIYVFLLSIYQIQIKNFLITRSVQFKIKYSFTLFYINQIQVYFKIIQQY
ncbi:transmembrane protein, putative (macronuclear) [Tetrahymena thermophila SB210]|uniref:Transmembrane protein, putative n=1 Tax=Tetrahymena thermophila (strain SB210) TaxID=312017 RepID=Q22AW7_TETTS|nr:transmembrane protein, putative [Tetrahymena thermophila SB210]EAR82447.2 transmembrane protein, putative [Tetrahymena thermophila SB210]|eukprot:XP_001030110.2 transmembrane protein, putative [Tetrahymena thermophila SB210]